MTLAVRWRDDLPKGASVSLENGNWRLECNAEERVLQCDNTEPLWTTQDIALTLKTLVETHLHKWQEALEKAAPPEKQNPRMERGYL